MKKFHYNKFLCLVVFAGLVASLIISMRRHEVEMANMTVDFSIDYSGLRELARREGVPISLVLSRAKEAGITSLAVYGRTFKELNESGTISATPGGELIERYKTGSMVSTDWRSLVEKGDITPDEVYITGGGDEVFREIHEDLVRRLGSDRVREMTVDGSAVLGVKAHYESFEKMPLGLASDEMRAANDAGFSVLARPANFPMVTAEDVRAELSRLDGFDVSGVVFAGPYALGSPDPIQATADEIKRRSLTLGLIEHTSQLQFYPQAGLLDIARDIGYKAARVYSIPKDEQVKLAMKTAVERWANACQERNIRICLLRIYEKPLPGMSLLDTNMKYIKESKDRVASRGFSFGPASVFSEFRPSAALRAVVMAGVAAACALYLSLVLPHLNERPRYELILFSLLAAVLVIPVLAGAGGKARLIASLASANVFPSLSIIALLDMISRADADDRWPLRNVIMGALTAIFFCGALSFVGALYLSGSLSDVEYFLEVNIFRGIKLTFILPILLVAVAFLQRCDLSGEGVDGAAGQIRRLLDTNVTVRTLGILAAVLLTGVVLIARSGHSMGMPVSDLEVRFRLFLEESMYARPRSKEMLIGHPAFMLAALAWARCWPVQVFFALTLAAAIGMGSMVETFAHMRTPVYMSFVRGVSGLALGGAVGAVLMAAAEFARRLAKKYGA